MGFFTNKPYNPKHLFFARKVKEDLWYYAHQRDATWNNTFDHEPPAEKRIMVILSDKKHNFDEIVGQSYMRYSCKYNISLHIMREFVNVNNHIHWEKFRIKEWLEKGYRVLFLDHDTYITRACPNLFDIVRPEYFGITDEYANFWSQDDPELRFYVAELGKMLDKPLPFNFEKSKKPYFNTGVFIAGPQHVELFNLPEDKTQRDILHDWPHSDQSWLNYKLYYHNVKVQPLVPQAQVWRPNPGDFPWILHSAGIGDDDRYEFFAAWDGQ